MTVAGLEQDMFAVIIDEGHCTPRDVIISRRLIQIKQKSQW